MWFNYRKTPLGTAVREFMAAVLGVYTSRGEAEEDAKKLEGKLSAEVRILDITLAEDREKIIRLDPDLLDVVRGSGSTVILLAVWGSIEP